MASENSLRVGSLLGIPLRLDYSWFVILGLVTFSYGLDLSQTYPEWSPLLAWGTGLASALLLFSSVLLHELGHSLVARAQGLRVDSITLFLFGGIAAIDRESPTPASAFQVAVAGPLVSVVLGLLSWLVWQWLPVGTPAWELSDHLWHINLILALFNLIPGLPLDGGQILKSAVWQVTGSRFTGVRWAARVGQGLGLGAIGLGLGAGLLSDSLNLWSGFSGFWVALVGWFIFNNASAYNRFTDLQQVLSETTAAKTLRREIRVLDASLSLRRFADDYLLAHQPAPLYFVTADGRYKGFVTADDLYFVERSLWESETLERILQPMSDLATVAPTDRLAEVISCLETQSVKHLVVLAPAGGVEGLIDRGDVMRVLADKLGWSIPDTDLQQVKDEGRFPPKLRLLEISQQL